MKTVLITLATLSACFALGWRLGLPDRSATPASAEPRTAANSISPDTSALALRNLQSSADPLERRLALLSLVENADAAELEGLFTAARLGDDSAARDAAARRWAELDPEEFYRHLTQLPAEDMAELNEAALILFSAWGRSHPEAALAAAKASSRQEGFKGVHWAALSAVLEDDPEKGFALALKGETLRYGREIQKSLWDKDPVRFVKACEVLDASGRRVPEDLQQARGDALMAWSETDFPGALAWTRTLNASAQAAFLPRLVSKLAKTDLPQARALFESLPPSAARETAGSVIAGALAKQDPQAALELIQTMTGGRAEAYGKWMNAVAEKGLDHAAGVLETLPEGSGRDQALRSLAGLWAGKDLPGAVN